MEMHHSRHEPGMEGKSNYDRNGCKNSEQDKYAVVLETQI